MAKKFSSKRLVFETLRFETLRLVATLALLKIVSIFASGQVHADEGRVHITFFKGASGNGSGYLFFQGQKYGLGVSSAKIGRVWATTIDLIGTASNLRNAADIIGTYIALDAKSATITHSKIARLENAKGSLTFER